MGGDVLKKGEVLPVLEGSPAKGKLRRLGFEP
jgi:hypothetical protein